MSAETPVAAVPATRIAYVTTVALSVRLLFANQLTELSRSGFDVTAISAGGEDLEAVRAAGIPHIVVPFTRRFNPLSDLYATWRLWQVLRRERFAVVHTHQPKPGLFGQIAARLAGVPVVVNTVHGFLFTDRSRPAVRRIWVWLEWIAARCSDRVLCVSAEDAQTAIRERIASADAVLHIGGGIDVRRFSRPEIPAARLAALRAELRIQPGQRVIGFVGRLVREKGIPELLDAFDEIRAAVPDTVLLLVGPTDDEKRDAIAPEEILAARPDAAVRFAGYRHDMPDLYALMDVFVLPSYREGLPQTLMEAAAIGVPAVTTRVRGCREVVVDGETGVLVPPGDRAALAAAVRRLLDEPEVASRMGRNACDRARQYYDERTVFSRLKALYAELLRSRADSPSTWQRT
jgi:glycosyltransferase involved in cell wall biosynthesis